MATLTPVITINSTPGLQVSTNVPGLTYNGLINSLGAINFDIDTLYYGSQAYNQLSQPITYQHYNDGGDSKSFVISIPISGNQYQPTSYVPLETRGVIIDAQCSIAMTMLANSQIQFIFYGKSNNITNALNNGPGIDNFKEVVRSMGKENFYEEEPGQENKGGQDLNFVADDMPAEELKRIIPVVALIPNVRKQTIILSVANNTSGNIPISLFNQGNSAVTSVFNAFTRYAWDITGVTLLNQSVSLLSYPVGSAGASTLSSGSLQQSGTQGLINLLNSFGVGIFWIETSGPNTFVVTWSDNYVYGGLSIGVATTVINWSNTRTSGTLSVLANAVSIISSLAPPQSGTVTVTDGDNITGGGGLLPATPYNFTIKRTLLAPPFTVQTLQSSSGVGGIFIIGAFIINPNYSYSITLTP